MRLFSLRGEKSQSFSGIAPGMARGTASGVGVGCFRIGDERNSSESLPYSDDGSDSAGDAGWTALKWSRISASNADATLHLSVLASPPFLKARVRQASDAHK